MHGRHIAFFPLVGRAHVYGFLSLCRELVRRGHRVTLVTNDVLAKLVTPTGAEAVVFEPSRLYIPPSVTNGLNADDPRWWEVIGSLIFPYILNSTSLAVWQLDKFYRENRPDLVVYDFGCYTGRIFAKRLHSPAIQYYYDFIYHNGLYCWENGVGYNAEPIEKFAKLLDSFLWSHGFEATNNFWHSEDLNLCPFPREFQFDADEIDSRRFCFVSPSLDRPFSPMWQNRSGGKRIILVSAITGSTDANYFNIIIDALSGSPYHVILSVGEHFPIGVLRPLPENFEINRYASHLEILPHVALHLYSAGINGTLEGFHFGVPLIALPSYINNYQIANRLAEQGVALNLPLHTMTAKTIRENVERVLQDDAFLGRVKHMQNVVRSSRGGARTVDKIEEYLAGCS